METKTCSKCSMEKPIKDFIWRDSSKNTRRSACKSCRSLYANKYYKNNKNIIKERAATSSKIRRKRMLKYVDEIKKAPCTDCGGTFHPRAMQFDHINPKTKNASISNMVSNGAGWNSIKIEIDKCELVCANCHAVRTHIRKTKTKDR